MYAPHGRGRYPESLKVCAAQGQSGSFSRIVNAYFTTLSCSPRTPLVSTCRPHAAQRRAGFTLIEMVAAMTLLVVGAFAVFTLLLLSIQTDSESADYSMARAAVQQQLEWYRKTPYASITSVPAVTGATLPVGGTLTSTVTPNATVGGVSITGLYCVTVTVSWTEPGRGSDSVSMNTYIGQNGLNEG
jgi:prepilin-type N-terminal cleavage/methylation domain-containing protein